MVELHFMSLILHGLVFRWFLLFPAANASPPGAFPESGITGSGQVPGRQMPGSEGAALFLVLCRQPLCNGHVTFSKKNFEPWLVGLSGLSSGLRTKVLLVRFPVRAHAWVAGQVPSRQPHIDVSLPLLLLPFPSL